MCHNYYVVVNISNKPSFFIPQSTISILLQSIKFLKCLILSVKERHSLLRNAFSCVICLSQNCKQIVFLLLNIILFDCANSLQIPHVIKTSDTWTYNCYVVSV